MTQTKMIIDADTGIDDAIAILYGLKSPKIQMEGITTVFGNIAVEQATENTLRIVKLAGRENEVPVSEGASRPLTRELLGFSTHVHGENGIGDVELPATSQKKIDGPAADFIIRKAEELRGELVIVAMGRLTNIAHALQKDPTLPSKVKHLYIMGGAVNVPGNVTPVSEANIWGDPEAADLVIQSGMAITLVGLDVTMKTMLRQSHLDSLQRLSKPENLPIADFMNRSMQYYFDFYREVNAFRECAPMHDPLTVLIAVEPGVVRTQSMHLSVECEGKHCVGMTVADQRRKPSVGSPVQVCVDVDADQAIDLLLEVFI
ncbi:nucleoside hydrolase [Paenibacillus glycanilyticus]|uniref:Inosine-uridine nucleoside N-ribohydrolase n=1 Tax=Paenibacillus glycanilyticus TaxID=126569 RepID=A0ABQ6GM50_9BACL|nr:nucleoside hydrolase [Paenibacillus glycanilyticus]GLX70406.1 inosine-uridine nucleoside N-ribohydrolase [Paenibacillus glycanilyticus]